MARKLLMNEDDFQRLLNLFPIIRPRDYHVDSMSMDQLIAGPSQGKEKEGQDAWDEGDIGEIKVHGHHESDAFWENLKLVAETKVGAAKAERYCKAFQRIHYKLVYEELSLDVAWSFVNTLSS